MLVAHVAHRFSPSPEAQPINGFGTEFVFPISHFPAVPWIFCYFCEVYITFAVAFTSAVGSCIVYSALVPLQPASNGDMEADEAKLGASGREDHQLSGLSIW